ncbi:uncharacterized protein KY384_001939 [Bacidia gigantensis]|uniref:uncharacterized protein n=1 Tax=Bacidia gigantensis TaxID=2732470 RepID=UPI001D04A52F|nr:uncharacterized protein KY384_001939 [Bacidia gigantensis]KAG8533156.1 hypothetical protein KY384_001939 [Bacidia gigantensis]
MKILISAALVASAFGAAAQDITVTKYTSSCPEGTSPTAPPGAGPGSNASAPAPTSALRPGETYTTYITEYDIFCGCSETYSKKTYTVTEPCPQESAGQPREADHIPAGFAATTTTCHTCAETPVVATWTCPTATPTPESKAPPAPPGAPGSPAAKAPAGSPAGAAGSPPGSGSSPAGGSSGSNPAPAAGPAEGAPEAASGSGSSPAEGAPKAAPVAGAAPGSGAPEAGPGSGAGSSPGAAAAASPPYPIPGSDNRVGSAPSASATSSTGSGSSPVTPFTGAASHVVANYLSNIMAFFEWITYTQKIIFGGQ